MSDDLAKSIVKAAKTLDLHDRQKTIAMICRMRDATDEHFVFHENDERKNFASFVGAYNYLARKGFLVASESFDNKLRACFEQSTTKRTAWSLVCVMEKPLTEQQKIEHIEIMNGLGSA